MIFIANSMATLSCRVAQAMAIVYGRCYEEIGPFNDTAFMVRKLEEVTCHH